MEFSKLRYFYAVAKSGSFTAAALDIHVSQPALSKMVKSLEDEIGARLFVRGKKGVELTIEGNLVFSRCQSIFGELDDLRSQLNEIKEEVTGDLAIGASDNVCNYLLPPLLQIMVRRFPKVNIKLFSGTSAEIQKEMAAGRAEMGLFYTDPGLGQEFSGKAIRSVEFVVVAKEQLRPTELSNLLYLGSRRSDYSLKSPALSMLNSVGVDPKNVLETNNQETQKRMAILGLGFTVVPIHMVESELKSGLLYQVAMAQPLAAPLQLWRRKRRAFSRPAEIFEKDMLSKLMN